MSEPEPATLWSFQPSSVAGWAVTFEGQATKLAVAGWGTYGHAGYSTIEPMVADPRPAPHGGMLIRAADLGVVTKLEFIRPDPGA